MTKLYRIEKITLKPLLILAANHTDAFNIFGLSLEMGLGHRPDADFDVVEWRPRIMSPKCPPLKWQAMGRRGIAWLVDDDHRWEMRNTSMVAP
jgi:hypothetical protein